MPSYACMDMGMECDWSASAETEEELLKEIVEHATKDHNMTTIPTALLEKIKSVIKK